MTSGGRNCRDEVGHNQVLPGKSIADGIGWDTMWCLQEKKTGCIEMHFGITPDNNDVRRLWTVKKLQVNLKLQKFLMNQQNITVNNQSVCQEGQSWVMLLEGMDMTFYYKRVGDNVEQTKDKISDQYLDSSSARVVLLVHMNVKKFSKKYSLNNCSSQDRTQSSGQALTSSKDNKSRSKSREAEKQKGKRANPSYFVVYLYY